MKKHLRWKLALEAKGLAVCKQICASEKYIIPLNQFDNLHTGLVEKTLLENCLWMLLNHKKVDQSSF